MRHHCARKVRATPPTLCGATTTITTTTLLSPQPQQQLTTATTTEAHEQQQQRTTKQTTNSLTLLCLIFSYSLTCSYNQSKVINNILFSLCVFSICFSLCVLRSLRSQMKTQNTQTQTLVATLSNSSLLYTCVCDHIYIPYLNSLTGSGLTFKL